MSNVILHIGMHKTGTTFLQKSFFPKLSNTFYAHNNEFFVPWKEQLYLKPDHMLLSYEGFSGFPWKNQQRDRGWLDSFYCNINQLKIFFPDATIIIFFRKQGDLLASLYKQYLNEGGELEFEKFYGVNKIIDEKDISIKPRIEYLKENFERVYCLNYQAFLENGTEYLKNFFEQELSMSFDEIDNSTRSNVSISGKKIEFLRRYNILYNRLPNSFKRILRISKLHPRVLVQNKLSFWKTKDNHNIIRLKTEINAKFNADWEFFLSHQYKSK